jgi:hypothetical protein
LFSPDGGSSWQAPLTVAAATAEDPQHVHPAIATDAVGKHLTIAYCVQQADGKLAVHGPTAVAVNSQSGLKLQGCRLRSLGPAFDLIPKNTRTPVFAPPPTTNYDRTIRPCYDIGEYLSATGVGDQALAVFGDNRDTWTSPPESPAAGTHTQPDVFAVFAGSW